MCDNLPGAIGQAGDDNARAETGTTEEAGFEDGHDGETLCICEDLGRNDLVGAKGLFRVDEGSENLAGLFAFAWGKKVRSWEQAAVQEVDSLLIEEGNGLLMRGMAGGPDEQLWIERGRARSRGRATRENGY